MVKVKVDRTEVDLNLDGKSTMICAEATIAIEVLIDTISEALDCSFDMAMEKAIDVIRVHKDIEHKEIKGGDLSADTDK